MRWVGGGFYAEVPLGWISGDRPGVAFRRPALGLPWGGLAGVGRRWVLRRGAPGVGFWRRARGTFSATRPGPSLGWVGRGGSEVGRARVTLGVGRLRVGFAPRYPLGWVHRVPLGWVGAKRYPGGGVRRAQLRGGLNHAVTEFKTWLERAGKRRPPCGAQIYLNG